MSADLEDLRLAIYQQLATTGSAPRAADIGAPDAIRQLAEQRHLVLDADGEIVLAHPFATIPLGFSVPSEAAAYVAEVGLTGAFWGLP